MSPGVALLRRLADNDETCLRAVLCPPRGGSRALDRKTRALVQLSALLAVDAGTDTLRWAVELATTVGADEAALVQVVLSGAAATGAAQVITSAARLALVLEHDVDSAVRTEAIRATGRGVRLRSPT